MLDRTQTPPFQPIKDIYLKQAESFQLSNGVKVHVINEGNFPVAKVELMLRSGNWFEPKSGVSYLSTKLLSEGTTTKTAKQISELIDRYGSFIDLHPGMDYNSISFYFLTRHADKVLPLLYELITDSIFPDEEIQTQKLLKEQHIKVNNEKNNIVASKLLRKGLFGEQHPYGRDLTNEELKKIEKKDIVNFYETFIKTNYEIVISGKIDQPILNLLETNFGRQYLNNPNQVGDINVIQPTNTSILLEKEKSIQSSIRLGKVLFTRGHEDYVPMLVLNEILGGYFGSRLMKNIREDKGYTYGISSSIISLRQEGYMALGTDVKKENTQDTINEIHKEIKRLQTELVSDEELKTVKNYMLGNFLSEINTPFSLADKYKAIYFNGLDYSYFKHYVNTINNISSATIIQMANKHLQIEDFTEVVVGGK